MRLYQINVDLCAFSGHRAISRAIKDAIESATGRSLGPSGEIGNPLADDTGDWTEALKRLGVRRFASCLAEDNRTLQIIMELDDEPQTETPSNGEGAGGAEALSVSPPGENTAA